MFSSKFITRQFAHLPLALPIFLSSDWIRADDFQEIIDTDKTLTAGKAIYESKCVSCHGAQGLGVSGVHDIPLIGDSSIGELSTVIAKTMPEDDPDACVGEDADAVAAYIHYSFYSPAAQIRIRPPQVAMSHLTANQIRQSLADLYNMDRWPLEVTQEQGLSGVYFNGGRWKEEEKKIERNDPSIQFDWGHNSPGEGIGEKEFYIHWNGSIIPQQTGHHEIIVRSTCSFVMDFGKDGRTFIDNHVQSGDKTEFRESIFLIEGRPYPVKIDFHQRERKTELPPASISLSWVPPHGTEEIIPAKNLRPGWAPAAFALQTQLPPDDRTYGYDRGLSISKAWDESTTNAALEFAQMLVDERWPDYLRDHKKEESSNREKLRTFLTQIVTAAFRGAEADRIQTDYVDRYLNQIEDDNEAIKVVMLVALKSPWFLYPSLADNLDPERVAANRLTLTLQDSLPADQWIRQALANHELKEEEGIRNAARNMLKEYRARAKVEDMMREWLNLSKIQDITKDPNEFGSFDSELVADLRKSLDALIRDVVWSDESDYRMLFLSDYGYTTKRIAEYYGDSWQPAEQSDGLVRTTSDPEHRFGVLTHPYMMSGLAYFHSTSPIHRGVFLSRYLFGRALRAPNAAFSPLSPDLHPDLTTRERVSLQTSAEGCQTCHARINQIGFVLENYDAVGRFRTEERSKSVDASGAYLDSKGNEIQFSGAKELAEYLAHSEDAQRAFIERAFQHFVKQPIAAFGTDTIDRLHNKFIDSNFNIRELIVEIAVINATHLPSVNRQDS